MVLILAGASQVDPQLGDLGAEFAIGCLGVANRLLSSMQFDLQVVVGVLVRTDQPPEPGDLGLSRSEFGRGVDGVGTGHGSECTGAVSRGVGLPHRSAA